MLLKHPANTDVAMQVLDIREAGAARLRVTVQWWNIGACHPPWPMGIRQTLTMTQSQWDQWQLYEWTGRKPPTECTAFSP